MNEETQEAFDWIKAQTGDTVIENCAKWNQVLILKELVKRSEELQKQLDQLNGDGK